MIPSDAGYHGCMGFIMNKLGPQIQWGCEIFIAFDHNQWRIRQFHHPLKPWQLGTHEIVEIAVGFENMHQHASAGRFSMTSSHHQSGFVSAMVVYKLGEAVCGNSEIYGAQKFRVVLFGVHPHDYPIQIGCDFFWKPTVCIGK